MFDELVQGYSPLGSQFDVEAKKDGGLFAQPVLNLVAGKLGKSPAQVALRWGIQMGHSVSPWIGLFLKTCSPNFQKLSR